MGLMDKVKAQANQLAQKTQDAAQEGKAKLDQAQANRRADALLRQLGAAVYAERTDRGTQGTPAKIDKLITAISALERENGLNLAQPPATVPQPGSPADAPGPTGSQPPADGGADAGTSFNPGAGAADAGTSFPPPGQSFFPPPGDGESGGSGFPPPGS